MLGKLLKHEIKHSARYITAIYIAVAALVGVVGLALITDKVWLGATGCFALYIAGGVVVIVTLVSVIKNFYDSLYGQQGYLTFTLPVKCSTLLISKVIVSFFWIIISFLVMAATFLIIFIYFRDRSSSVFDTIFNVIAINGMSELLPNTGVLVSTVIVAALLAIMTMLTYVGYVYFTVTVANTRVFQSHPKFYGGLVFFGIFLVTNTVSTWLTELIPLTFNVTTERVYFAFQNMNLAGDGALSYGIGGTIFTSLVALGLLFATGYIMEHKVNLK